MKFQLIWSAADWSTYDVSKGYHDALTSLGHESHRFMLNKRIDFYSDALELWARNSDMPSPPIQTVLQYASNQALIHAGITQPDVCLLTCAMGFHPDALALLRNHGYPIAMICSECPYNDEEHEKLAELVDFVFVNDRDSVDRLARVNPRTYYLPTAFSLEQHKPDLTRPDNCSDAPTDADVLFVGTGFPERQAFLEEAVVDPAWPADAKFQIFGFFNWAGIPGFDPAAGPAPDTAPDFAVEPEPSLSPLTRYLHDPISNDETAYRYTKAKIVLNFYRNNGGYSMNPRAYEAAACHSFQLSQDTVPEQREVFGENIGYFTTPHSLAVKVAYYLQREEIRNLKAEAAYQRVWHTHSYANRVKTMVRIFEQAGIGAQDQADSDTPTWVSLSTGTPVTSQPLSKPQP